MGVVVVVVVEEDCHSYMHPYTHASSVSDEATHLSVDLGTSTRCGPVMPVSDSQPSREMDCSVFPRPISSAKIPFSPERTWTSKQ